MILLHIIGGLVGLTSGAVALSAPKGGWLHRKSGIIFVYAMLVLSVSGAVMAALKPERISVIAGLLTFYLVITALLTVRRRVQGFDWMTTGAMLFVLIVGLLSIMFSIESLSSASGNTEGYAPIGFIFGIVSLLAAVGDARFLLTRNVSWTQRIARHLWRMCFALWIAAASFFLGQADEIPEVLRIMPLLCTPVLLVLLLMFYWLVRVLFTQWRPQA
jgi:peptidoglycan/LPS O-acetylase OafA/YrhL